MIDEGVVYVDGVDLATLGFVLADHSGWRRVVRRVNAAESPGRAGGWLTDATDLSTPARDFRLTGTLLAASGTETDDRWSAIVALVTRGVVSLRVAPTLNRFAQVVCTEANAEKFNSRDHPTRAPGARATLSFVAVDPYRYDVDPVVVTLDTQAREVPLGSAPSGGLIRLAGPLVNPTVELVDAGLTVRGRMGFTVPLGVGDGLDVDLQTAQVTRWTDGVPSDGAALLTVGSPFALDPSLSPRLFLRLSAGSGAALYRRAWAY